MTRILALCTANLCRSPMAAALLRLHLARREVEAEVTSAGCNAVNGPPPAEVVAAMVPYDIDIAGHMSRQVGAEDLSIADLVLAMTREHVRYAVVSEPAIWPRTFTLKELVRRGEDLGPRLPDEPFPEWLAHISEGRERSALLGGSPADDVTDPIGGPPEAYASTASELDGLVRHLCDLAWSRPASVSSG
ncbi:MAG: arsenate reductase/protein-tyrosine-phosphatase family protein [Acidimicrobiales bacterium]